MCVTISPSLKGGGKKQSLSNNNMADISYKNPEFKI